MLRGYDGYDYLPIGNADGINRNLFANGWYGDVGQMVANANTAFYDKPNPGLCTGFFGLLFGKATNWALGEQHSGEHVIGIRVLIDNLVNSTHTFGVASSVSTRFQQWSCQISSDGSIRVFNGDGSLVTGCPAGTVYAGSWCYVEFKFTVGSASLFEIRVNTVVKLSVPSYNFGWGTPLLGYSAGFDTMTFACSGDGAVFLWDDVYYLDTADTSDGHFDYLGNVKAVFQPTYGAGSVTNWNIGGTSPAATNWQSVLNSSLTDEEYVTTDVVNDRDLYQVTPSVSAPSILAVMLMGAYRLDDATQRYVANTLKTTGGNDLIGSDKAPDQTFRFYRDIFVTDPDTSAGWSQSAVNALEIGPKLTG